MCFTLLTLAKKYPDISYITKLITKCKTTNLVAFVIKNYFVLKGLKKLNPLLNNAFNLHWNIVECNSMHLPSVKVIGWDSVRLNYAECVWPL